MEEANTQSLRLQRGVWWFIFARERVCIRIYLWRLPIQIYQFKCAPIEKWWLTLKMVHPTAINQQSLSVRKSKSYRPTLFLTVDTILNAESKLFKTLSWIGSLFGSVTRGGVSVMAGRMNSSVSHLFLFWFWWQILDRNLWNVLSRRLGLGLRLVSLSSQT